MMNKNKSLFLTIMLMLCALTPMSSIVAAQPAAPARQGVAAGVLSDMWGLSTCLFKGAYNVGSKGYELWNQHMTKEGVYATAGIVGAVALYNYYYNIESVRSKYNPKTSPKLCVWGQTSWENHIRMRENRLDVLARLDSERPECINNRQPQDAQRAALVQATIIQELDELRRDMKSLENQFLVFFKAIEYLPFGWKALGIERNYKRIKPAVGEEIEWSLAQFYGTHNTVGIDSAMKNAAALSWWHPLCLTLNYGNAAYVWWELKKLSLRLELLSSWINPIAEGKARFPDISNANVGITHNQATFKHAVSHI